MLGHTVVLVRGQIPCRDRVPILFVQTCKNLGKSAGALTPGAVYSGDHSDLSINVQSATHHTPQSNVGINTQRNIELYEIRKSPIISSVVEECLVDYADKHSAKELFQGLKFGFKLNYSGPPGAVHSGDHADLSINVQSATHHTPQSNVGINTQRNIELYEIGKFPIISSVVEECLVDYADKHSAKELLQDLKFGFKLNYSGPRKTCFSKNLRSTQRFPEAVR